MTSELIFKNLWLKCGRILIGKAVDIVVHDPMHVTSKIVVWKLQTNLTHVETIQYDTVGGVLDCLYTSEEAWIFNPSVLKPLD